MRAPTGVASHDETCRARRHSRSADAIAGKTGSACRSGRASAVAAPHGRTGRTPGRVLPLHFLGRSRAERGPRRNDSRRGRTRPEPAAPGRAGARSLPRPWSRGQAPYRDVRAKRLEHPVGARTAEGKLRRRRPLTRRSTAPPQAKPHVPEQEPVHRHAAEDALRRPVICREHG